jgi:hypothetical protein
MTLPQMFTRAGAQQLWRPTRLNVTLITVSIEYVFVEIVIE